MGWRQFFKALKRTKPSGQGFTAASARVQQTPLPFAHGLPDLFLKRKWRPALRVKPSVDGARQRSRRFF